MTDLDDLFNSTHAAAVELHRYHNTEMGVLKVDIDYNGDCHGDCDCCQPEVVLIETLDDLEAVVSGAVEKFEASLDDIRQELLEDLESLGIAAAEADIDPQITSAILASKFRSLADRISQ